MPRDICIMPFRNQVFTEIKMKQLILFLFSIVFLCACTEEYDLELSGESKLVVDFTITNAKPPYYIQLTKSKMCYGTPEEYVSDKRWWWEKKDYEMVCDARVIVSDDCGVIDTLELCPDSVSYWDDDDQKYHFYESSRPGSNGYYRTTKIEGIPGNTYNLRVEWQGNIYTAECKMPKAVAIDTITSLREADKFKDGVGAGFIPYLWFHDDPATPNYYVFEYAMYGGKTWGINIMSDEQLNSDDICGIDAYSGEAPDGFTRNTIVSGTHISKDWGYDQIRLYSVTKEVYEYYSSLIKQIRYDGGVYTPSPASAPTNIKGGALGVFNAASVDWRYFY